MGLQNDAVMIGEVTGVIGILRLVGLGSSVVVGVGTLTSNEVRTAIRVAIGRKVGAVSAVVLAIGPDLLP